MHWVNRSGSIRPVASSSIDTSSYTLDTQPEGSSFVHKQLKTCLGITKLVQDVDIPVQLSVDDPALRITLIQRSDNRPDDTVNVISTFHTGLILTPPPHYHLELYSSKELLDCGYMVAGGVQYVPTSDMGELMVHLIKFRDTEDLELGCRSVLALVKPSVFAPLQMDNHESQMPKMNKMANAAMMQQFQMMQQMMNPQQMQAMFSMQSHSVPMNAPHNKISKPHAPRKGASRFS